jgi:hypothetical protein
MRAAPSGLLLSWGEINGSDFPPIRYSRVYVKRDGKWKVVMFHMTRITADQ